MKKVTLCVMASCVLAFLLPSQSLAETKKFRLYSYLTKFHIVPVGFAKVPANAVMERRGLAQMENGEVAAYLMRGSAKFTPKGGTAEGFSQYTYSDGSTSVVKWELKLTLDEKIKLMTLTGEGSYVSGTGSKAGIQGDVTFEGRYITPYSPEKGLMGDMIVDVTSNYTLP